MAIIDNLTRQGRKRNKVRREIENAELNMRLQQATMAAKQMEYLNDTISAWESRRIVLEDDDGWITHGQGMSDRGDLTEQDIQDIQTQAYLFWKTNPHARAVIRGLEKYVIGRGANVDHRDEGDGVRVVWDRFEQENAWAIRQKEIVRRGLRDGEVFIYKKKDKATDGKSVIKLRFIEPFEIQCREDGTNEPSYGVYTSAKDVEDVKGYNRKVKQSDGSYKDTKIKAEDVIHIKLNSDSTDKRGVPILEPIMSYITKYEQWLNDRIVLNRIRTAVALVKKYDATPQQLQTLRDEHESTTYSSIGYDNKQKAMDAGTVIHTNKGVEYEFLTPNLNARDVATDGRAILLAIAAGSGMPEYIVTGDSSNANYSSTLVAEAPGVREVEDYQSTFSHFFEQIYRAVMEYAIEKGELKATMEGGINMTLKAEFNFPSLIYRDFLREQQAYAIQYEHEVLSRKTWQQNVDLDPENEKQNMEDDPNTVLPKAEKYNYPDKPGSDSDAESLLRNIHAQLTELLM